MSQSYSETEQPLVNSIKQREGRVVDLEYVNFSRERRATLECKSHEHSRQTKYNQKTVDILEGGIHAPLSCSIHPFDRVIFFEILSRVLP